MEQELRDESLSQEEYDQQDDDEMDFENQGETVSDERTTKEKMNCQNCEKLYMGKLYKVRFYYTVTQDLLNSAGVFFILLVQSRQL